MIYGYYSELLTKAYEKKLNGTSLTECITAYRSIPLNKLEGSRNKCNIDFANDIFEYINSNKQRNLVAVTFDITAFFDNLNHSRLKESWLNLLPDSDNILPPDHYAVFKNLTKFSYIEFDEIFEVYKNEMLVEENGKIKKAIVPRADLLKEKNAVAFCQLKDFGKIRSLNLIKNNIYSSKDDFNAGLYRKKGIPQGSPISATLANIYLYKFDDYIKFLK